MEQSAITLADGHFAAGMDGGVLAVRDQGGDLIL
jgi:hypothetical protein